MRRSMFEEQSVGNIQRRTCKIFQLLYSAKKYPKGYSWDSKTAFFRTGNIRKPKFLIFSWSRTALKKNKLGSFDLVYFCNTEKMSILGFEHTHIRFTAWTHALSQVVVLKSYWSNLLKLSTRSPWKNYCSLRFVTEAPIKERPWSSFFF